MLASNPNSTVMPKFGPLPINFNEKEGVHFLLNIVAALLNCSTHDFSLTKFESHVSSSYPAY